MQLCIRNDNSTQAEVTVSGTGDNGQRDQNFDSRDESLIMAELTTTDYVTHQHALVHIFV